VCPLIEESDKLQAEAAIHLAERLRAEAFNGVTVGLLHGRMRPDDKDAVMEQFRTGEIRVLVATPVIEVGIDVPEATIMIVEDADRFGLAQLHQLRGRVGRGPRTSFCVLLSSATTEAARDRLETMAQTSDGFVIAQRDLELRGPGELMGTRQHGLPDLRIADLLEDAPILQEAHQDAGHLLEDDADLSQPQHAELGEHVRRRFAERPGVAAVG
jgi:ATP-dependent DNA helicase RecG